MGDDRGKVKNIIIKLFLVSELDLCTYCCSSVILIILDSAAHWSREILVSAPLYREGKWPRIETASQLPGVNHVTDLTFDLRIQQLDFFIFPIFLLMSRLCFLHAKVLGDTFPFCPHMRLLWHTQQILTAVLLSMRNVNSELSHWDNQQIIHQLLCLNRSIRHTSLH